MNPAEQPIQVDLPAQEAGPRRPSSGGDDAVTSRRGIFRKHPILTTLALLGISAGIGTCAGYEKLKSDQDARQAAAEMERLDRDGQWSSGTPDDCTNFTASQAAVAGCDDPHLQE